MADGVLMAESVPMELSVALIPITESNSSVAVVPKKVIKRRTKISLKTRLEIINEFKSGKSKAQIGRNFGIDESTVRKILQNADKSVATEDNSLDAVLSDLKQIPPDSLHDNGKGIFVSEILPESLLNNSSPVLNTSNELNNSTSSNAALSRNKSKVSLKTRLEIIKKFNSGDSRSKIGRDLGIDQATLRKILQNSGTNQESVSSSPFQTYPDKNQPRPKFMHRMEDRLLSWLKECEQKYIPIKEDAIKAKAYALLSEIIDSDYANEHLKEWYSSFQMRHGSRWKASDINRERPAAVQDSSLDIVISEVRQVPTNSQQENKKEISLGDLDEVFNRLESVKQYIMEFDPDINRSVLVCCGLESQMTLYRAMYGDLLKTRSIRTTLDGLFK